MKTQSLTYTIDNIDTIAEKLWSLRNECAIYTFTGPLGAGKTTLVQAMLSQAGVTELYGSPTFTIVNVYKVQHYNLFHFDLYRITNIDEFLQGGFNEYLYAPNSWCFIEWPEIISSLLMHNVCKVTLDYQEDGSRLLTYTIAK